MTGCGIAEFSVWSFCIVLAIALISGWTCSLSWLHTYWAIGARLTALLGERRTFSLWMMLLALNIYKLTLTQQRKERLYIPIFSLAPCLNIFFRPLAVSLHSPPPPLLSEDCCCMCSTVAARYDGSNHNLTATSFESVLSLHLLVILMWLWVGMTDSVLS